jgi:hypothetical protein
MRPIRTCCERSTDSGCGWGAVLHPETLRCACNTSRRAPPRAYDPDISSPDATAGEWAPQAGFVVRTVGSDHVGIGLDLAGGRSCTPKNAHEQIQLPDIPTQMFIGGRWSDARSTFVDVYPATERELGHIAKGTPEDIDDAVRSARKALDGEWGATPGAARGRLLNRLADLIERDAETLATLEALDIGKPISQPRIRAANTVRALTEGGPVDTKPFRDRPVEQRHPGRLCPLAVRRYRKG